MDSTQDASRPAETSLRNVLKALREFDPEALARTEALGTTFDFSRGVPLFMSALNLFLQLDDLDLGEVPDQELGRLTNFANQLKNQLTQISEFDPTAGDNPAATRDNLINQLQQKYNDWFKEVAPIVAYTSRRSSDTAEIVALVGKHLEQVKLMREELDRELEAARKSAEGMLAQIRETAGQAGVAQQAGRFRDEASRHAKARKTWLWATVIAAVALLGYGGVNVWFYLTHELDIPPSQTVQLALSKLVVFGTLSFALMWTSKMYRAESHNFVVNQHRQNALATFETFVNAAGDDQTRNAVLLQATRSIFAHQPTGFATTDQDAPGSTQVLEIIRSILPGHGQQ